MISLGEGLEVLRNWQTQNADLWVVTVETSDDAFGPTFRIRQVSSDPPGFVYTKLGSSTESAIDLKDAEFNDARPDDFRSDRFVRFLAITWANRKRLLCVEIASDNPPRRDV